MEPMSRTLVVLPALNEEASVGRVIDEIRSSLGDVACLVVDDGSRDRTSQRAREAGATVVRLPYNLGVGGAMRVGFAYALTNDFDNVVQVDADGQHDAAEVLALVVALDSADVVVGARFAGAGEYDVRGPRRWAMRLLSWSLTRIAGTVLTDTTSGFRASGPRAVRLFAEHYPAEYLGDTIESLVIAARAGCTITQVPAQMRPRAGGVPSHDPLKAALYLGRAVMALLFALMRPRVSLEEQGTAVA